MNTIEIINEIEANPGLKAQLRAVLLGDELLEMPRQFAKLVELVEKLAKTQNEMKSDLSTLKEGQKRLESDVSTLKSDVSTLKEGQKRLESDVSTLKSDVSTLKEGQKRLESDVSTLKSDVSTLKEGQKRLEVDVSDLKGSDFERTVREKLWIYLEDNVENIKVFSENEIKNLINKLNSKNVLTRSESERIKKTDIIASANINLKRTTIVAEVSTTLHKNDITRVVESASILRERKQRVDAFAITKNLINDDLQRLAEEKSVRIIYFE
jgi:outer membrane murein-binding lipoprotein Lpp